MSKKAFFLGALAGILMAAFIGVIGVCVYISSTDSIYAQAKGKLNKIDNLVDLYFLEGDELEEEEILDGIYRGYMSALEDPYSVYYNEEETKALDEYLSGTFSGIGAVLTQNMQTYEIVVNEVLEGSGAMDAGLQPQDIILEVDGEDLSQMLLDSAVNLIRGEEGTKVTLTIYREGESDFIDLEITRKKVEVPSVEYEVLDGNIGYIELTEFEENSLKRFEEAYADLMDKNVKGLIVDLRDNPGGLLPAVCQICGHFVPKNGLVVYTEDKYGNTEELFANTNNFCTVPLVILVNEYSASASEIFAGAVKAHGTGTIIGTTTYGKGIVQQIIDLNDGTSVKMTVSEYFAPDGTQIHGIGVVPDIEVELSDEAKKLYNVPYDMDTQLQAAVKQIEEECK